jgi:predicted RNase H-like HicB family nuclease
VNGRVLKVLRDYLQVAMRHAHYEILTDDGSFYGEIPECNGVYANAPTLEECREQLEEVLEEWVLYRVHKNLPLPVIEGHTLEIKEVA